MPKVLLTGMTGLQTATNRRRDYISFIHTLPDMLEALGYIVYWGAVEEFITYKLSDFDLVLCGLSQWNSRVSAFAYNALLASCHSNVVYYIDDWQLKNIQITDKVLKNLFNDFMVETNKLHKPLTIKLKNTIQNAAEKLQRSKINLIAPTFNWGNPKLLLDKILYPDQYILHTIDPSPFISLKQLRTKNKAKKWVCSSLKDIRNSSFIKKLKLTWPIEYYYNKNYVSEKYLFDEVYSNNYGIISQKYYHAGSGWWRMRFLHSIYSNSILLADQLEVEDIGPAYILRPDTIELATDTQLVKIAANQRDQFLKHQLSKDETLDKFSNIINVNK